MSEETYAAVQRFPRVIGVDVGGTQLRVAVLSGATLLSRISMLTGRHNTPNNLITHISVAIQQAIEQSDTDLEQIAGIGIGVPGPVNGRTGEVFMLPNLPGWDHVPLRDILQQDFGETPVFVENDANAAGLGEYIFGAGRDYNDVVYLTVSTGIGSCVIIDGRILRGASGTAGEIGHTTVDLHGERCNCGNVGCLERVASGTAIAHRANEAIAAGTGVDLLAFARTLEEHQDGVYKAEWPLRVDAETVARAAEAGVPLAREIITQAAQGLGVGLVNIIHSFNPEMIILGGGVIQIGPLFMEPAAQIVRERAMKGPREAARIVPAQLGENVGLIGAGALIYHSMEKNALFQR